MKTSQINVNIKISILISGCGFNQRDKNILNYYIIKTIITC